MKAVIPTNTFYTVEGQEVLAMTAPDSWEQIMDPHMAPAGQTAGDLNMRFSGMNVNAHSFVPNVQAQSFVPGGAGVRYPASHHGGYPMHGELNHTHTIHGMHCTLITCLLITENNIKISDILFKHL